MKLYALLVILNCWFVVDTPFKSTKLQYDPKVGDSFELDQKTDQVIKQSIMGMDQEATTQYIGKLTMKVLTIVANTATVEVRFIKLRNSSKTMMGENVMDSEGPEDNVQNKIFKSMMDKPFSFTMKRNGDIESVSGTENLWSDMDKLELDEETRKNMKEVMVQFMSESSLKKSLAQAFVYYSEEKVNAGDTWKSTSDFPMDFPIRIDNTWKLAAVSGKTTSITATGKYTTTDSERIVTLPGGFKAKVDLSGTQDLTAKVTDPSGWADVINIDSSLNGKMILQAGGMIPTDMEIPMVIKTKTSYITTKK